MRPGRSWQDELIEQALFFAIGFLAALLLAVVALPVVSGRAMRLAEARARLQAPATEKQAAAERDALRAQYAVEYVSLERRAALAEERAHVLRAELGRHLARIAAIESTKAGHDAEVFDLRGEIERLRGEGKNLEVALAASQIELHDAFAQRDRAMIAEARAMERAGELEAEINRGRAKIAILTARGENSEGRIEDASRSAKAARQRAEKAQAEMKESLNAMAENVRRLEERVRAEQAQNAILAERLQTRDGGHEDDRRRIAELESRLAASERAREETLLENGRQLAVLADREAALTRALEDAAILKAELSSLAAGATARSSPADDAALRAAIARLGQDVARMFSTQRKPPQIDADDRPADIRDDAVAGADEERRDVAEPQALAHSRARE